MKKIFLHNLLPHLSIASGTKYRPTIMLTAVCALVAVGGWQWWQSQTEAVTPDQRATISCLVNRAAQARNISHQRIYADLFKHMNVRRTEDMSVSQYNQAMEYLMPLVR